MKVIDNKIGINGYNNFYLIYCNRLSRILVNNGFGDLKVRVGSEEISCVRSILMNGNETIRKLLLDEKMGEVLELYEKCEIKSFLEIEKYYSGGIMELDGDNVCNILRFSVYYNDNGIMLLCIKYLKSHLNDSIMLEILSILNELKMGKLYELRDISGNYLKLNGYKYLENDSLLLKLSLESIKFILKNMKIIINDENWLLDRLMLWYRNVLKEEEYENEKEKKEELEEFKNIIKTRIHINEVKIEETSKEAMLELENLKINLEENRSNHICLKLRNLNNELLKNIIIKNYYEESEEEENEMFINEKKLKELGMEEMKNEMVKLLNNEDIRIIEIILNILMRIRMDEIIPIEIKNRLLLKLLYEYNSCKRIETLRCLCLFVDDNKNIITIENLCGKEVLFRLLNEEYYLNSKSKELLMKYIVKIEMSKDEEKTMLQKIEDEELLEEIVFRRISYTYSEYSFGINEEISIVPSFNGNQCEFSITPSLPSGMFIDKDNGIIHGKVDRMYEKNEYEVKCKNIKNEKKFKISIEFIDIKFTELNKSKGISISNDSKTITNADGSNNHCYLNMKMENGISHIKYKFHQNQSDNIFILLGLSTNNTYSGNCIFNKPTTCNYYTYGGKSQDITSYCHIGTIVNKNPNFKKCEDGSIYEIIVDMNKREYWISHNNSSPVLLVKDLPSPLYPYVYLQQSKASVELLSVSYQN